MGLWYMSKGDNGVIEARYFTGKKEIGKHNIELLKEKLKSEPKSIQMNGFYLRH